MKKRFACSEIRYFSCSCIHGGADAEVISSRRDLLERTRSSYTILGQRSKAVRGERLPPCNNSSHAFLCQLVTIS